MAGTAHRPSSRTPAQEMRPGLLDIRSGSLGGLFIHQTPLASVTLEAGLRPGTVLACFSLRLCGHPGPEGTQVGRGCSGPEEEVQAPRGSHLAVPSLSHAGRSEITCIATGKDHPRPPALQ